MYKKNSLQNRRFCFVLFCFVCLYQSATKRNTEEEQARGQPLPWNMSIVQQNSPALQARAIANHPTIKFTIKV